MNEPANPEVPPPRYTETNGWRRLIEDEQEWLARPARWGITYLPESRRTGKTTLFEHHYYGRIAEWIACPVCRPLVQEAFAEDGVHIPGVLSVPRDNFDHRIERERFRGWYSAQHRGGACDAWDGLRSMNYYECGVITMTELRNRLIDNLYGLADRLGREGQTNLYSGNRTAWERELALELVGPNPFRPINFDSVWLTSTVVVLAQGMFESRDFSPMPILADALQDAGCDSEGVLNHLRDPNATHVRGCWVVDLVRSVD